MYNKSTLDNSIQVVTKKMEGVRSVSIGFLIDASPTYEEHGKYGVAHLTEHLMFRGTTNRGVDEIASLMDMTGGSLSAFTSKDYTCYTATVLDEYRTYILDLMGDMFLNSEFTAESIQQEKSSISHELASIADHPDACAHEKLKGHIWQGHSIGRPIGGTIDSVESLQRNDVKRFVDKSYLGNRLIVGAAGNLEHNDFVSNLHDVLWAMKSKKTQKQKPLEPHFHNGAIVTNKEVRQVYFSIGIKAAAYTSQQRYEIHLLNSLIGGGVSSRLFKRLRQASGLVYEIHSEYQAYRDAGIIVIEGATVPELLEDVITQIFNELHELARGNKPIDEEELWKVKMQLKGQHLIATESTPSSMSSLVTQSFYFNRIIEAEEILAQIESITLNSLNNCAHQLLVNGLTTAAISVVGPKNCNICNKDRLNYILNTVN